ncbi:hypothetical protein Hanom_Chr12g01091121 [Helianthus anomalus]
MVSGWVKGVVDLLAVGKMSFAVGLNLWVWGCGGGFEYVLVPFECSNRLNMFEC